VAPKPSGPKIQGVTTGQSGDAPDSQPVAAVAAKALNAPDPGPGCQADFFSDVAASEPTPPWEKTGVRDSGANIVDFDAPEYDTEVEDADISIPTWLRRRKTHG
jgi:hypothetical protein